jgi:hypothetical protein
MESTLQCIVKQCRQPRYNTEKIYTSSTWSQSSWSWNCYCKVEKYKSPGSDQISAELIQAGGEMLLFTIHKLINSVWNKEELPDQWKESIIVPIHKKGDKTL